MEITVHIVEVQIYLLKHYLNYIDALKELTCELILDIIGKDIEKPCQSNYPFHALFARKWKC